MSTPLRNMVHETWAGVAANWGRYADALDLHETAVTERMLEAVAVQPGDRVLELACGPGGVGLVAAPLAGADGEIVLSDVAEEMVAIAVDRAHTRGLTNVRGATLDLEDIDQPDASYDVVLCRQGLMFAVDPEQATREIHRVLRPGGRASLAAWGPKAANPWLGIVFDAVSCELGHPVPPPGIPGPFNLETLHDCGQPSRAQASATSTPKTSRHRDVGAPSTSGGPGQQRLPGRSPQSSPASPKSRGRRSSNASAPRWRRTRHRPQSRCPASLGSSPLDGHDSASTHEDNRCQLAEFNLSRPWAGVGTLRGDDLAVLVSG